jgi:hypothetical protein
VQPAVTAPAEAARFPPAASAQAEAGPEVAAQVPVQALPVAQAAAQ